jgi:hypothetical protein
MKTNIAFIIIIGSCLVFACKKEQSELFKLLTTPVWTSDSLLANDVDAGGPGGLLEKFKGDAKFKQDGTGYFGKYKGSWIFAGEETQIVIYSDSLPVPSLTTNIIELTENSLKITTGFPIPPAGEYRIRMTFKAK